MKSNYIILYADQPSQSHFRGELGQRMSASGKGKAVRNLKFGVAIEELESSKVNEVIRKPNILAIAPAIPLKLISPVKSKTTSGSASGGTLWNIEAVGANQSPFEGDGIRIAILDTGIDKNHPAFTGVRITEKDFTGEGNGDTEGHGTHCAGVAFGRDVDNQRIGIARQSNDVLIAKVLGVDGGGSDILINAINWAVESGANIISMSLGIDFPGLIRDLEANGIHPDAAVSMALDGYRKNVLLFEKMAALVRSQSTGKFTQPVIIIGAAGNESARPTYKIAASPPAVSDGIIPVGALGKSSSGLYVAPFSNSGAMVSAPGVDIFSAQAGTSGLIAYDGTSMATPHVAGVAALWAEKLLSKGQFNIGSLYSHLTVNCNDQQLTKEDSEDYGAGIVQAPLKH